MGRGTTSFDIAAKKLADAGYKLVKKGNWLYVMHGEYETRIQIQPRGISEKRVKELTNRVYNAK